MSRYDELQKLNDLKAQGALTDAEFEREKERLLNAPESAQPHILPPPPPLPVAGSGVAKPWGMDVKLYCMLLHLSQFAGHLTGGLGLALPIVMWAVNKDEFPEVDAHGKVVLNWFISALIYAIVCFLLVFLFIGVPLFFALGICSIIFPIIGAVKANDGQVWKYPGTFKFF